MGAHLKKYGLELLSLTRDRVYHYSEKPFRLSSGKTSHHYYDCKAITMIPINLELLALAIKNELVPLAEIPIPNAVGGMTLGADPIAYALSLAYLKDDKTVFPFTIRKAEKSHGMERLLEAQFYPDNFTEVVVLDDTVTTGASMIRSIEALREHGFRVKHAIAVIDRKEGASDLLKERGIFLHSLFTAKDFQD